MWAAGALRGSPASTTATERRWRPSWSAAARPAADPPITATSTWRRTERADPWCSWPVMRSRYGVIPEPQRTLQDSQGAESPRWRLATAGGAMVDDIEQAVRQRLRALRTTLGLSLDDLAERTNLSPSTISR